VLATVPGAVGVLWLAERCRTWLRFVGWMCVFGAVGIGTGYHWLAQTVRDFGGLGVPASWVVTAVFGVSGTVHAWIFGFFYRGMLARGRRPHPIVVAALVVAVETLPVRLFPWSAGHGAVDVPPLLQLAEWGGVPLVSFALYCLVVPVWEAIRSVFPGATPEGRPGRAAACFALGAALFGLGLWRYRDVRAEDAAAKDTLRVSIVQANVGSHAKRDATTGRAESRLRSVAAYERGTRKAVAEGAELVVWPETAITAAVPLRDALQTNSFLARSDVGFGFLNELGRDRGFLVGVYEAVQDRVTHGTQRNESRYNDAALRQAGDRNATWTKYRKVFLIPFGEAMPFGLMKERLPQGFEMLAGKMPQEPLEFRGVRIVPFLCYEGILPEHVRALAGGRRPHLLASLTNDSWFGDTWEPWQHLNFTRFRAVEHRAPMVRATNTGVSAFVNAAGDVESLLGVGEEGVLTSDVPLAHRGETLYARFGFRFPWLAGLLALFAWLGALLRPPP
jgi:apolipoprotein N-acyltransferase